MAASATATIDGTLTINAGRTFNTNNATVVSTVNGTINNSGTVTCTTAAKLLMQSGSTYTHSQNGGNVPTATWNSNSTCNITGVVGTDPTNVTQSFGNLTWNCAGQTGNTFPATVNITGTLTIANTGGQEARPTNGSAHIIGGSYNHTGGIIRWTRNAAGSVTVTGNVSISGGECRLTNGNSIGTLSVGGNFSITGTGILTETGSSSGSVVFPSGTHTYTSGGTVSQTINFTVNSGATLNMAAAGTVVSGAAFTVAGGGTLGITSTAGIVTAPTASGNIQTTARTFNTTGNYSYIGSGAQVTGNALPTTVNNFTINNAAGLNLTQDLGINGVMTFTNGVVNSNSTNTLTINDNATVTGASNSSYVDGFMVKVGDDNFTFPVGDPLGSYHPITVNNSVAANPSALVGDTYNAEYFRASALTRGPVATASGMYAVSNCEHWSLNRTAGAGTPDITVSWTADSPCGGNSYVTQTTGLVLAWLDLSNEWQLGSGGAFSSSGVPAAGTTQQVDVNQFGFFALGNTAPNANPLPVKIGSIKAYEKAAGVQLDWTAFTEINADKYVIERSANGQQFTAIGEVAARNLSIASDYGFFDPNPLPGISFYRLRNLDQDGKSGYSNIVRVNLSKDGKGVIVYPNPVRAGAYLSYGSSQLAKGLYTARIFNAAGQQVFNQQFAHAGGAINQTIQLPAGMKAGIYAMQLSSEEITVSSRTFIVQ